MSIRQMRLVHLSLVSMILVFLSLNSGVAHPVQASVTIFRPLDLDAVILGSHDQGEWVEFTHTLGPDPGTLHPVKVYSQDYATLWGIGRYVAPLGQGTASYDMFGDGRDGVMPSSGNLDYNNGVGVGIVNNGSAGSYYINVTDVHAVWRINSGDVVLIHQTQGTNAGCWELNKAVSDFGGGTATYKLEQPLRCNYTSNVNNHAQILRVPQYTNCPVSGTVTPLSAWNGSWGGIFAVICRNALDIAGSILLKGSGYRGGVGSKYPAYSQQGEGENGLGGFSKSPNGIGGGGSYQDDMSGGGGGNATVGGSSSAPWGNGGQGGGTFPAPEDLSRAVFGGGGGGGLANRDSSASAGGIGGNGGGFAIVIARRISIGGFLSADGANGANGTGSNSVSGGGGGAGGAILLRTEIASIGNNQITAVGGEAGLPTQNRGNSPGNGGLGRIRIEYCDSLSGSTNPRASTQKLSCYIAEQVESAPDTTRLNLPETFPSGRTYKVQYGRHLVFNIGGAQSTTLRVPAGQFSAASMDVILVDADSGDLTLRLDIGADGTWDWGTTRNINGSATLSSPDLASAFNQFWNSRGKPSFGDLDVPIVVTVDQRTRVLLTNLVVLRLDPSAPMPTPAPTPTPTPTPTPPPDAKRWTFMLYLAGDTAAMDNGTVWFKMGQAIQHLEEGSNSLVKVVALLDGPGTLDTFRVTFNPRANYQPLGEKRMDDPTTLIEFVQQARREFPADHYYLAIADHANGVDGIAWDTTTRPDRSALLTPSELRQALSAITDNGARPLDILHYDACSFALLENAQLAAGLVRYVIASQNTAWGAFLYDQYRNAVGSNTSPGVLARAIGQRYVAFVTERQWPHTVSVLDLGQMGRTITALNNFAAALKAFAGESQANRNLLNSLRSQSQKFDSGGQPWLAITDDDLYVDLVDFAARARARINSHGVPGAADSLITALTGSQPLVLYESHRSGTFDYYGELHTFNLDGARGVSIYYPPKAAGARFGDYITGVRYPSFYTAARRWVEYLQVGLPPLAPGEPLPQDAPEPLMPLLGGGGKVYLPIIRR
jgi:hypothetical protein